MVPAGRGRVPEAWLVPLLAGLVATGCKSDDGCVCGSEWTASQLSCSASGNCEGNFELIGHDPLLSRGMNAAPAIAGNIMYVGSRTDGVYHDDAGILIVDIADPALPRVVGQIGPPDEAVLGLSSRELRVVPDKNLLVVLNLVCRTDEFLCGNDYNLYPQTGGVAETANLKLYDITNPLAPRLVGRYDFGYHPDILERPTNPHEFYLWRDPVLPDRLLVYVTVCCINQPDPLPNLQVIDISDPSAPRLVTAFDTFDELQVPTFHGVRPSHLQLHSASVSDDGRLVYLAHFGLGFLMLDASAIAANAPEPRLAPLTPLDSRVDYSPPYNPNTHSAVPVPGRDLVILTDEVLAVENDYGCPWGWGWMVDVADPRMPKLFTRTDPDDENRDTQTRIVGQIRLPVNDPDRCDPLPLQSRIVNSAHNPTLTEHLVLLTWYASGLQAFDITDPARPVQVGAFYPEPIASVETDDPINGGAPRATWSYPIVKDGLIYVVDIRNGLYVLRYTGPHAEEVAALPFREGNSNLR